MKKRNILKYETDEEADKVMDKEKVQWPIPVRTESLASQKHMVLAVNSLSATSKKQLWDHICKEDRFLATLLQRVKIFETREVRDSSGNKVVMHSEGFGVCITLLNDGVALQKKILQQQVIQ